MSQDATDNRLLIGRTFALQVLQRGLDALRHGRGMLTLITGEAGIGKTTLALACGERARAAGATFAVGRCYERGIAPPFTAWNELLANLHTLGDLDVGLLPPPFGRGQPAQTTYQLMQAVVTALQAAAAARPLVVLLDDLHWADQETLDLLDVATRRLADSPLLVLVTYRFEAIRPGNPFYEILPNLQRNRPAEQISLGELSVDEAALLVEARYGPCSPQLAAYLHARSDGHPLFLVELLRDLVSEHMLAQNETGQLLPPAQSVAVPTMLTHVIMHRIAHLGADAEALLQTAAVVGETWELAVVEAVLGWPEEHLLRVLESALAARVIVPVAEAAERYRFVHGLFREVVYSRQLWRRRKQLHACVGAVLERLHPDDEAPDERVAALAHHFGAAEQWNKAVAYSTAAGDAARVRFASHSALQFYRQALDWAARDPSAATPAELLQLQEQLGQAHMVLYQKEAAAAVFSRMLESARAQRDRLAEGRALCHLTYILAWLHRYAEARTTGEAGLRVAEETGQPQLRALSHTNLATLHIYTGDLHLGRLHLEQAEPAARASGALDVLGRCAREQSLLALFRGQYRRAEQLGAEALALAQASHSALDIGATYFWIGLALGETGRYEEARHAFQAGLDHVTESDERRYGARLLNAMGWLYCELGDVDEALRWDRQALEVARAGRRGEFAEMERYSLLNVATDELRAGRLDEAEAWVREFEPLLDRDVSARFRYLNRYQLLKAELALALGALASAVDWAAKAEELAAAKDMPKNLVKAWLLHGRALLGQGRADEAALPLLRAVEHADRIEHGALRWQSRLWLGHAHAALHRPAFEVYQQAVEQVDALADALLDPQLRERFLAAPLVCELRAAAAVPVAIADYPAGLSEREVEVLRLIAQGSTNRVIAETLHISVKTVNAHVGSILSKTGCANRAAAAAFALRHALT